MLAPRLLLGAAVVWNLISLRAETLPVTYLDDSSIHEQMVRFATAQLQAGHLPLSTWFPYLGLGSPQFLHYQSLPAMLAGVLGVAIGPDAAFRWTLYLILALWPVSVYLAARLFGGGRMAAAASAAMAPFLVSATGVGFEQGAYLWSGYGLWAQLWAMFTLPIAWGLSWRAIREGRGIGGAVAVTALTVALHFETGYLALAPLFVWPLVAGPGTALSLRLRRAAVVLVGALLASAWVVVPLLAQRNWAATNEILHGGPLENGYGAGRVLGWLASGQLLDHGRLPVITGFAALGLVVACAAARRSANRRALLVALAVCLVLSFGRATFGSLVDLIPGAPDIFFRRFMMGIQLASLLLAGQGAAWAAVGVRRLIARERSRRNPAWTGFRANDRRLLTIAALAATVGMLAPAWLQLRSYDNRNAAAIRFQRHADAIDGANVDRLVSVIRRDGGGRVYAGMPSNWGAQFTVGSVPVFKYLESRDVDEVGYTLRTASLMTDPEYYFDESDPSDYRLFGIHYLLLPSGVPPPVPARLLTSAGAYALWARPGRGYVQAGAVVGRMTANRTDVGVRSIALLHTHLAGHGEYLRVGFDQRQRPAPLPLRAAASSAGTVSAETDDLAAGRTSASVTLDHSGIVVLSASFDPGWSVTVDGRSRPTEMVAPALVAVPVAAGTHRVAFRYHGYRGYPVLFALAALTLLGFAAIGWKQQRWRSSGR